MPMMEYMEMLKPGDKMTFAVQKMKPTWLSEQSQGQPAASQAAALQAPAPQATMPAPAPPPMPSLGGPGPVGMTSIIEAMQRRRGY